MNTSTARWGIRRELAHAWIVLRYALRRYRTVVRIVTIVGCFAIAAGVLVALAAAVSPDGSVPALPAPTIVEDPVAAPEQIQPVPPAPAPEVEYQVQAGDTLAAIAVQHGVAYELIAAVNGLADPDVLVSGQVLRIPPPAPGHLMIAPGDTFIEIAQRLGVDQDALATANPQVSEPDVIIAGSWLRVPEPR